MQNFRVSEYICGLVCTLHEILVTVCINCDFRQVNLATIQYMVVKICDFAVDDCLLQGTLHLTVECAFKVDNVKYPLVLLYLQETSWGMCVTGHMTVLNRLVDYLIARIKKHKSKLRKSLKVY